MSLATILFYSAIYLCTNPFSQENRHPQTVWLAASVVQRFIKSPTLGLTVVNFLQYFYQRQILFFAVFIILKNFFVVLNGFEPLTTFLFREVLYQAELQHLVLSCQDSNLDSSEPKSDVLYQLHHGTIYHLQRTKNKKPLIHYSYSVPGGFHDLFQTIFIIQYRGTS